MNSLYDEFCCTIQYISGINHNTDCLAEFIFIHSDFLFTPLLTNKATKVLATYILNGLK